MLPPRSSVGDLSLKSTAGASQPPKTQLEPQSLDSTGNPPNIEFAPPAFSTTITSALSKAIFPLTAGGFSGSLPSLFSMNSKSTAGTSLPPLTQPVPLEPLPLDATDVENPPNIDHAPPTSSSVLAPFFSPTELDEEPDFGPAATTASVATHLPAIYAAGRAIHGDGAGMDAQQERYSERVDKILKLVVPLLVASDFALFVSVPPSVQSNLVLHRIDSALLFLGVVMPLSLIRFLIRRRVSSTPEMKKMAMLISFVPLALDFLLRIVVGF